MGTLWEDLSSSLDEGHCDCWHIQRGGEDLPCSGHHASIEVPTPSKCPSCGMQYESEKFVKTSSSKPRPRTSLVMELLKDACARSEEVPLDSQ